MSRTATSEQRAPLHRRLLAPIEKSLKFLLAKSFALFIHVKKNRRIDPEKIRSILIVRQHNQLGDMLCAVPLLRALRFSFPHAFIGVVARPLNAALLRHSAFVDEVFVYEKLHYWTSPFAMIRFLRRLRKKKFDLALTPATVATSVSSDVIAFLSKVRVRIGPNSLNGRKNPTAYLYHHRVDLDWREQILMHQTQRNLEIARVLEMQNYSDEVEITLTDSEIAEGRSVVAEPLRQGRLVIGFHCGAAKPQNRWDALRFADLANRCAEILGAFIVVSCGPDDEEPVREMLLNMPNEHLNTAGIQLRMTAAIFKHCDAIVSNDTGMMHVSAGVGTPTVSLFGPTDPLQWAPNGPLHRFVFSPNGRMDGISVDKVWQVLTALLADRRASPHQS